MHLLGAIPCPCQPNQHQRSRETQSNVACVWQRNKCHASLSNQYQGISLFNVSQLTNIGVRCCRRVNYLCGSMTNADGVEFAMLASNSVSGELGRWNG